MHSLTKGSARTCFGWLLVKVSKPQGSLAEAKAVVQRCSAKNLFLKISQNSLVHSCFSVNFMEFLRTLLLIEHLWWLLFHLCKALQISKISKPLELVSREVNQWSFKRLVNDTRRIYVFWPWAYFEWLHLICGDCKHPKLF